MVGSAPAQTTMDSDPVSGFRCWLFEQRERVCSELGCDAFDGPQRQVAFTAFEAAHVGPMKPQDVSHRFLGKAARLPVATQVQADDPLQISFGHCPEASGMLPLGLQTYK